MGALNIVGESLIFLALCWFVPKIVSGVLGGAPAFTGGEIIAVASPIVYGSVMAAKAAVSLATSGYSALAGGGQAGGGALTASVAPPSPTGPPEMNSSNAASGQPGPPPLFGTTTGAGQPPPPNIPKA
jgi:type IV secretory pathway TrbL component